MSGTENEGLRVQVQDLVETARALTEAYSKNKLEMELVFKI